MVPKLLLLLNVMGPLTHKGPFAASACYDQRCLEIEFKNAEVAVEGIVGAAPCARRSREVIVTAAARAYGAVHAPAPVETAGAAVHMLVAFGAAEIRGVGECAHVDVEYGEVEILAVRGALESVGCDGKACGGERDINVTAPAADVDCF